MALKKKEGVIVGAGCNTPTRVKEEVSITPFKIDFKTTFWVVFNSDKFSRCIKLTCIG